VGSRLDHMSRDQKTGSLREVLLLSCRCYGHLWFVSWSCSSSVFTMSLTESQASAVETAEKVSSVLSVVGAAFIISTFLLDTNFRKPINRLVFYAAWGNLFANVATLISRSGIRLGVTSSLCQFQGFLIQW